MSQPIDEPVMDRAIERVLRVGTWVAAGLLAGGLVVSLVTGDSDTPVLHAGLWVLIATPIVRVLVSLGDDVKRRDWTFATLTSVVLLFVALSLLRAWSEWTR